MVEWGLVFVRLADKLPEWASSAFSAVERQRLAILANDLAKLAFWSDGMLLPLKRIAGGTGKPSDLEEIAWKLNKTEKEVVDAGDRLRQTRDSMVGSTLGMRVMHQLDSVVFQKLGPGALRPRLKQLVVSGACSSDEATSLVYEIDAFNAELDRVHRLILATRDE